MYPLKNGVIILVTNADLDLFSKKLKCPKCDGDLIELMLFSNPPKYKYTCLNCGFCSGDFTDAWDLIEDMTRIKECD